MKHFTLYLKTQPFLLTSQSYREEKQTQDILRALCGEPKSPITTRALPVIKLINTAEQKHWRGCWTPVCFRGDSLPKPPSANHFCKIFLTTKAQFLQPNTSLMKQMQSTAIRTSALADTRSRLAPNTEPHSTTEESHSWATTENTATNFTSASEHTHPRTRKRWCTASTNSLAQNTFWRSSKQSYCR